MNYRIFVGKKDVFQGESRSLEKELSQNFSEPLSCSLYNIYDIFGAAEEGLELLKSKVLADPATDEICEAPHEGASSYLAFEYLPGQYDQRADSAEQCLMLLNSKSGVRIKSGRLLVFKSRPKNLEKIKNYLINPIEMREKDLSLLSSDEDVRVAEVPVHEGFTGKTKEALQDFLKEQGLAMSLADLLHIQAYFKNEEKRQPTETEIRVLDTYWSDHCRHTTFETALQNVRFEKGVLQQAVEASWQKYLKLRQDLGREHKPVTLMDIATIGGRTLKPLCPDWDISEENNACSIRIDVDVEGLHEPWLLMFKNETHNHPTEIEPFGGASTCIGGAIRDPLSGRAYVYQAMRITGAGNVLEDLPQTLPHKLPQKKISKGAALGYSSYGNQIGLATSFVKEIYHEGYKAKRMEVGAVVGAVPLAHVRRESPKEGDIVILLGGRTGRDGIGGATGSSKEHNEQSVEKCASEVQKGNAPVERRIQRLFRNPAALALIKKCNDFGAGGVSVAVGEIARGVEINLDAVPVKYLGLNGTEIALSESQERMAVVVEAKDAEAFQALAHAENLESALIARVSKDERLRMSSKGRLLVDIARPFLDTNGVLRRQDVCSAPSPLRNPYEVQKDGALLPRLTALLSSLNGASQRGMAEMFDASIGRGTVLMPFGGKYQLTEAEASVHKLPVKGFTSTCSLIAYGFDPYISEYSPYLGAQYAVIDSLTRITAAGGDYSKARLSFQEYFERLGSDEKNWGKPFQALLGALEAQLAFSTPAIGGKDSMSGTFMNIKVPPTLISFAVCAGKVEHILSPEFKKAGSFLTLLKAEPLEGGLPDYTALKKNWDAFIKLNQEGKILSAMGVRSGGIAESLAKMSFGNKIGMEIETRGQLFAPLWGSLIIESAEPLNIGLPLGRTVSKAGLCFNGEEISIDECIRIWEQPLEALYPLAAPAEGEVWDKPACIENPPKKASRLYQKPKVLIAVFPGSNCEYDTQKAFEKAGAETEIFVFNNLSIEDIKQSCLSFAEKLGQVQIFAIPGGFSAGDEPDGSGKFIANVLQNPFVKAGIEKLLAQEGLIIGICNGFQALVKSGLLPYGAKAEGANPATLFHNAVGRHVSRICTTRISSNKSPWLSSFKTGEVHSIALSHGEGRFMLPREAAEDLFARGQVAMQYCDADGRPTMDGHFNLNGAFYAIEGIISPCGQILGKMAHSERWEEGLFKNIHGNKLQDIFANGVNYFK